MNLFQQQITPLKPNVLAEERVFVYVPAASEDQPGLVRPNNRDFIMGGGALLSLRWPMGMLVEDLANPLARPAFTKLLPSEFVHTGNITSVTHPDGTRSYASATAELQFNREQRDAFTRPDFIMVDDEYDFEREEVDGPNDEIFHLYRLRRNDPTQTPSLIQVNNEDFRWDPTDQILDIFWPYAHQPATATHTDGFGLMRIKMAGQGSLGFDDDGDLEVCLEAILENLADDLAIRPTYGESDTDNWPERDEYLNPATGLAMRNTIGNQLLSITKEAVGLSNVQNRDWGDYTYSEFSEQIRQTLNFRFDGDPLIDRSQLPGYSGKLDQTVWDGMFGTWEEDVDTGASIVVGAGLSFTPERRVPGEWFIHLQSSFRSTWDTLRAMRLFLGYFDNLSHLQSLHPASELTFGSMAYLLDMATHVAVRTQNVDRMFDTVAEIQSMPPWQAGGPGANPNFLPPVDSDGNWMLREFIVGERDTRTRWLWQIDPTGPNAHGPTPGYIPIFQQLGAMDPVSGINEQGAIAIFLDHFAASQVAMYGLPGTVGMSLMGQTVGRHSDNTVWLWNGTNTQTMADWDRRMIPNPHFDSGQPIAPPLTETPVMENPQWAQWNDLNPGLISENPHAQFIPDPAGAPGWPLYWALREWPSGRYVDIVFVTDPADPLYGRRANSRWRDATTGIALQNWEYIPDEVTYRWFDTGITNLSFFDFIETDPSNILMNGPTASVGGSGKWVQSDHIHPHDTSRLNRLIFENTLINIGTNEARTRTENPDWVDDGAGSDPDTEGHPRWLWSSPIPDFSFPLFETPGMVPNPAYPAFVENPLWHDDGGDPPADPDVNGQPRMVQDPFVGPFLHSGLPQLNRAVNIPYVRTAQFLHNWKTSPTDFQQSEFSNETYWGGNQTEFENLNLGIMPNGSLLAVDDGEHLEPGFFTTMEELNRQGITINQTSDQQFVTTRMTAPNWDGLPLTLETEAAHTGLGFQQGERKRITPIPLWHPTTPGNRPLLTVYPTPNGNTIREQVFTQDRLMTFTADGTPRMTEYVEQNVLRTGGATPVALTTGQMLIAGTGGNQVAMFAGGTQTGRILETDAAGAPRVRPTQTAGRIQVSGTLGTIVDSDPITIPGNIIRTANTDTQTNLTAGRLMMSGGTTNPNVATVFASGIVANRPLVSDGAQHVSVLNLTANRPLISNATGGMAAMGVAPGAGYYLGSGPAPGFNVTWIPPVVLPTHLPQTRLTANPSVAVANAFGGLVAVVLTGDPGAGNYRANCMYYWPS